MIHKGRMEWQIQTIDLSQTHHHLWQQPLHCTIFHIPLFQPGNVLWWAEAACVLWSLLAMAHLKKNTKPTIWITVYYESELELTIKRHSKLFSVGTKPEQFVPIPANSTEIVLICGQITSSSLQTCIISLFHSLHVQLQVLEPTPSDLIPCHMSDIFGQEQWRSDSISVHPYYS